MITDASPPGGCRTCRATAAPSRRPLFPHFALALLMLFIFPTVASAALWTEFERAVGKVALEEMKLRHGFVEDPLLQGWVDRVAAPVAAQSTRHLTFDFHILGSYEDNAFSLPGGHICVTRGLLSHVTSDEELAGVIAHEVAHTEDRDFQRLLQQQLLYVGGQSVLRNHVDEGWVYVTQVVQVLDTLRSQRKHELQADLKGTELAYAAHYNPQGVATFLQQLSPNRDFGGEILATHPQPDKRAQAVRSRIKTLESDDYEGLVAVGDSLRDRLHYAAAAGVYEQAGRLAPDRPEAAQRLADIRHRQGLDADLPEVEVALTADERARVAQTRAELQRREQDQSAAEKRLRTNLIRFQKDREIARALEIAQVLAPELDDAAYLATLARAYYALQAAWKEAMRQGEILSRSAAIRTGWERSAADLQKEYKVKGATAANETELRLAAEQFQQSVPALVSATEALNRSAGVSGELSTATRTLALAFLALVGSGPDQPLGRLNYTRFLILQGDIFLADNRIRRVARAGEGVHAEIVRRHLEAVGEQISLLHATSRPALRELDYGLVTTRLPAELQASSAEDGSTLLGQALLERHAPAEASDERLQALDAVLRICYLDMRAEREQ